MVLIEIACCRPQSYSHTFSSSRVCVNNVCQEKTCVNGVCNSNSEKQDTGRNRDGNSGPFKNREIDSFENQDTGRFRDRNSGPFKNREIESFENQDTGRIRDRDIGSFRDRNSGPLQSTTGTSGTIFSNNLWPNQFGYINSNTRNNNEFESDSNEDLGTITLIF